MIALRAPQYLTLGIASTLTAGIWLIQPAPTRPGAPAIAVAPATEPIEIRSQSTEKACDTEDASAIVIRGQFTSHQRRGEGFAISFAGSAGQYTAMTDPRGYFEVHIPREDFDGDLCNLPLSYRDFSDEQMTLRYRIDVER